MKPLLFVLLFLMVACGGDPGAVSRYSVPKQTPSTSGKTEVAEPQWRWNRPDRWENLPASGMRLASFAVPLEDGQGSCSLILLAGNGGGLIANINRWRGQLGLPQASEAAIMAEVKIHPGKESSFQYILLENPAQPQQAFLTGIISYPQQTLFIKLILPQKAVQEQEKSFLEFVASISRSATT